MMTPPQTYSAASQPGVAWWILNTLGLGSGWTGRAGQSQSKGHQPRASLTLTVVRSADVCTSVVLHAPLSNWLPCDQGASDVTSGAANDLFSHLPFPPPLSSHCDASRTPRDRDGLPLRKGAACIICSVAACFLARAAINTGSSRGGGGVCFFSSSTSNS